jgi:NitT/TauT family transport system substrate-binding protein
MKIKSVLFFFLATLIVLAGCGNKASSGSEAVPTAASGGKKLKEVTVATSSSGIAYGAIYLAQEENIWEKYGLKVNLISMDSSAFPAAVISGDVPIVNGSGSGIINAAIKTGGKVKVSGTLGTVPFMLYAGKDVKKLEDMKGKIIGAAPGSSSEYAAITLLKSVGLTLGKDVNALQVIGGDTLLSISQGKIDAGFIVPPMSVQADKMQWDLAISLICKI